VILNFLANPRSPFPRRPPEEAQLISRNHAYKNKYFQNFPVYGEKGQKIVLKKITGSETLNNFKIREQMLL
jgi:hypothetical protein